jgi:hypothetical protein
VHQLGGGGKQACSALLTIIIVLLTGQLLTAQLVGGNNLARTLSCLHTEHKPARSYSHQKFYHCVNIWCLSRCCAYPLLVQSSRCSFYASNQLRQVWTYALYLHVSAAEQHDLSNHCIIWNLQVQKQCMQ